MKARGVAIALVLLVFAALHQDSWSWKDARLAFGFLPVGLAYHACYSVASALLMWVLVARAWPAHLEHLDPVRAAHGDDAATEER